VAAAIAADPEMQAAGLPADSSGIAGGGPSAEGTFAEISPEAAGKWLDMLPDVAAKMLHNEDYRLQPHEREIMLEPFRALLNKKMPEVLKKTDSPELTLIGFGLLAYAARVGLMKWLEPAEDKPKPKSSEGVVIPPEPKAEPEKQRSPVIVGSVGQMGGAQVPLP